MADEDSSIVDEVLERVITRTVCEEELEASANARSPSIPSSLDYGDLDDLEDNFKENGWGEDGDGKPVQNRDIATDEAINGRSDDVDVNGSEDEICNEPEYVVERIVEKRIEPTGRVLYYVKWKNYPSSSNTWEPVENLLDCDNILQQFEVRSAERLAEKHALEEDNQPQIYHAGPKRKQRHLAKEYEVNDVMGITKVGSEKYFLVSLSNSTQKTFIRASLANRIMPDKVIDFYIKSMKWKVVEQ